MGRRIKDEMDEEAAVAGHVMRSRRMLSDMFEQGSGILANMAGSRERIKVRVGAAGGGWKTWVLVYGLTLMLLHLGGHGGQQGEDKGEGGWAGPLC